MIVMFIATWTWYDAKSIGNGSGSLSGPCSLGLSALLNPMILGPAARQTHVHLGSTHS